MNLHCTECWLKIILGMDNICTTALAVTYADWILTISDFVTRIEIPWRVCFVALLSFFQYAYTVFKLKLVSNHLEIEGQYDNATFVTCNIDLHANITCHTKLYLSISQNVLYYVSYRTVRRVGHNFRREWYLAPKTNKLPLDLFCPMWYCRKVKRK